MTTTKTGLPALIREAVENEKASRAEKQKAAESLILEAAKAGIQVASQAFERDFPESFRLNWTPEWKLCEWQDVDGIRNRRGIAAEITHENLPILFRAHQVDDNDVWDWHLTYCDSFGRTQDHSFNPKASPTPEDLAHQLLLGIAQCKEEWLESARRKTELVAAAKQQVEARKGRWHVERCDDYDLQAVLNTLERQRCEIRHIFQESRDGRVIGYLVVARSNLADS